MIQVSPVKISFFFLLIVLNISEFGHLNKRLFNEEFCNHKNVKTIFSLQAIKKTDKWLDWTSPALI